MNIASHPSRREPRGGHARSRRIRRHVRRRPPRPTFSDDAGSEETFSRDDDVEDDARSGARGRWREEFVGRERTRDDDDDDAFEDAREVPRRRREAAAEEEEDDLYAHFSRARVAVCEYAREDAMRLRENYKDWARRRRRGTTTTARTS